MKPVMGLLEDHLALEPLPNTQQYCQGIFWEKSAHDEGYGPEPAESPKVGSAQVSAHSFILHIFLNIMVLLDEVFTLLMVVFSGPVNTSKRLVKSGCAVDSALSLFHSCARLGISSCIFRILSHIW